MHCRHHLQGACEMEGRCGCKQVSEGFTTNKSRLSAVVPSSWQNSSVYEEWLKGNMWSQTFGLYLSSQLMLLTLVMSSQIIWGWGWWLWMFARTKHEDGCRLSMKSWITTFTPTFLYNHTATSHWKHNIAPVDTYTHSEIVHWSASLFNLAVALKLVTAAYAEALELFWHMI